MVKAARETRSKFLKIKCPECSHEQIIFEKATSVIECANCGKILAEPTGGKVTLNAEIVETYE